MKLEEIAKESLRKYAHSPHANEWAQNIGQLHAAIVEALRQVEAETEKRGEQRIREIREDCLRLQHELSALRAERLEAVLPSNESLRPLRAAALKECIGSKGERPECTKGFYQRDEWYYVNGWNDARDTIRAQIKLVPQGEK